MDGAAVINKFEDVCYRCGKIVQAKAGLLDYCSFPGLRWPKLRGLKNWSLVEHQECAEKYKGTDIHYRYKPDTEVDHG